MSDTINKAVNVYDTTKRVRKLVDNIEARGGFIYGNIELIETAIDEIDSLLVDEHCMANKALSAIVEAYAPTYKILRENYWRLIDFYINPV